MQKYAIGKASIVREAQSLEALDKVLGTKHQRDEGQAELNVFCAGTVEVTLKDMSVLDVVAESRDDGEASEQQESLH